MSTIARRKLLKDLKELSKETISGIHAIQTPESLLIWDAIIFGPEDTIWDGGIFRLSLQFTEEYPNKPPTVLFVTPTFHPNIYKDGQICLDILQQNWSSLYDIKTILISIRSLLVDPNPDSPANNEAAKIYVNDINEYNKRVRKTIEESWTVQ